MGGEFGEFPGHAGGAHQAVIGVDGDREPGLQEQGRRVLLVAEGRFEGLLLPHVAGFFGGVGLQVGAGAGFKHDTAVFDGFGNLAQLQDGLAGVCPGHQ